MKRYRVFIGSAAQRDIKKLPPEHTKRIIGVIRELKQEPRRDAKKLESEAAYRLRVGVYRIVFTIDDSKDTVFVVRVKHRRDVYRKR